MQCLVRRLSMTEAFIYLLAQRAVLYQTVLMRSTVLHIDQFLVTVTMIGLAECQHRTALGAPSLFESKSRQIQSPWQNAVFETMQQWQHLGEPQKSVVSC